jgi:alkaline phosphatase D
MHTFLALFLLFVTSSTFANNNQLLAALGNIKRIAFGSCNNQNDAQPLWKDMLKQKPDLFIWGGDNIYADWGKSESLSKAYEKQNAHPDYAQFKSLTPYIGTWDDHDFAFNDADGNNPSKKIGQQLMLDFFEVATDSPRRFQEGIYTSHEFGDPNKRIKFILLDNRYFKGLDIKAPLLGQTQWAWLENELKNSRADLHFIITGLSIYSPLLPYSEEWRQFPSEYKRMQELLKTYQTKAPVFISGDKHFSSIFKYSGQLEFLSSGMTHTVPRKTWYYLSRKFPTTYFGISYGQIDIDWEEDKPKLNLMIRNGKDEIHKRKVIWSNNSWIFL